MVLHVVFEGVVIGEIEEKLIYEARSLDILFNLDNSRQVGNIYGAIHLERRSRLISFMAPPKMEKIESVRQLIDLVEKASNGR